MARPCFVVCMASILVLVACTPQDVANSMGASMKGLCRNSPERCTVYNEDGKVE